MKVASPGQRYLAYMVDLTILICIATLVATAFGIEPFFFELASLYFIQYESVMDFMLSNGSYSFGILGLISFFYFSFECYTNFSFGKRIFNLRIAGKRSLSRSLVRGIVKSVIPLNILDSLFIYRYRKYGQRFLDKGQNLTVVSLYNGTFLGLRRTGLSCLIAGGVIFYLPIIVNVCRTLPLLSSANITHVTPSPGTLSSFSPTLDKLYAIFMNNFSIFYNYYLVGGLALSSVALLQVFTQALFTGVIFADSLASYPSFIVFGIFPHFFVETLGLIFGLASGFVISSVILDLIERYFRGASLERNKDYLVKQTKVIFLFCIVTLGLLLLGAFIEIYITSFSLSHFY